MCGIKEGRSCHGYVASWRNDGVIVNHSENVVNISLTARSVGLEGNGRRRRAEIGNWLWRESGAQIQHPAAT